MAGGCCYVNAGSSGTVNSRDHDSPQRQFRTIAVCVCSSERPAAGQGFFAAMQTGIQTIEKPLVPPLPGLCNGGKDALAHQLPLL